MKTIDKKYFENPEKYIPKGFYCYDHLEPIYNKNKEMIPYLKKGDWEENGTCFLWDQVKECGINDYTDEELEEMNK